MRFSINSRVLEHLGKDLITSDEIAVTELMKNAYDAGAKLVTMHLINTDITEVEYDKNFQTPVSTEVKSLIQELEKKDGRIIVIEDNGDGMSRQDLENGFFTIGTDIKKKRKEAKLVDNQRLPLGEKGIGRLAAQRLSKLLILETTNLSSNVTHVVCINWDNFMNQNLSLDKIDMDYFEYPKQAKKYTRLWLVDLNIQFNDFVRDLRSTQLNIFEEDEEQDTSELLTLKENLLSSLSFLLSPFDNAVEDFDIEIFLNEDKVHVSFKNEAIKVSESEHSFTLNNVNGGLQLNLSLKLNPWYIERIHQGLVGKDLFNDWRKTPLEYKELLEKYQEKYNKSLNAIFSNEQIVRIFKEISVDPLKDISPIEGKVYSFKREQSYASMAIQAAKETKQISLDYNIRSIRGFLASNNGIKLYRGKYRIATLGDKESDWLHLQQARTKGQQFFRFELGNVIGYVKINDPYQDFIKETSSRLNLTDNPQSKSMFHFLEKVYNEQFYRFSQSAYYITRDILNDEGMLPSRPFDKLKEKVNETEKKANSSKQQLKNFEGLITKIQDIGKIDNQDKMAKADEILNNISSAGKLFKETLEDTLIKLDEQKVLVKQVEHEKQLIELEAYNNYKLMANGLITEVLTHELHSILTNLENVKDNEIHFTAIEDLILKNKQFDLYSTHLNPIKEQTMFFNERISDLSHFYAFLEKTFLYNGTIQDFEEENIHKFLSDLEKRLKTRLNESNLDLQYEDINMDWLVPRGVLIHIFYNLIDNSIYWIKERRIKQKKDISLKPSGTDFIRIKKIDDDTIYYFDSGTGIIPKMENTLFQPLESGKDRNGRGMGLYIVRQLLRSFDADIILLPDRNKYGNRYIFAIYNNNLERDNGNHNRNKG
ncbi:ATP-binding protein [Bacillus sp. V59.32b]|uniref:ATP-binding protein n=1 Tax=Bacillus sp. V59.32b TaxID=1758642 RepID=UPI001359616E|nr:ATP-binding protein [Bacillus sp. V59.32b]